MGLEQMAAHGVPTVAEFWERHKGAILAPVRPHTQSGYEVAWRRRVRESFGDRPLSALTTWEIESAAAAWQVKDSTNRDALACLSAIMRAAVKAALIPVNPCKGVQLVKPAESDPTGRALNRAEVGRLFAVLPQSGPYRAFIACLLYTGMRFGEVAALLVSDCDFDRRVIKVSKTASPGRTGELRVGPTKNGKVRMVAIPDQLLPFVVNACAGKVATARVFPGPRGGTLTSKNLSRAVKWARIREQVKAFPEDQPPLHWHDLRHTNATMLFLAGSSAPDVMAQLGHSSLQVTQLYANTKADAAMRGGPLLSAYFAATEVTLGGGEAAGSSASLLGS